MIDVKRVKEYCGDDYTLIENYDLAINDTTKTYHLHHRAEILPCGKFSVKDLNKFGLYWKRPANELIFLTQAEHRGLHARSMFKGRTHSEESKKLMSEAHTGKYHSEETKKKMSANRKGRHWWNNGCHNKFCKECPDGGWTRGRL